MASLPDPIIQRRHTCANCQAKMGAIRVYSGLNDPAKAHSRGRICQTCSSAYCHWTVFHTDVAYIVEDAEALVERIAFRELGIPIPAEKLVPLRLAAPPPPAPTQEATGSIPCANEMCRTSNGNRTRGCVTCIEFKCESCCRKASQDARDPNTARNSCPTHNSPAVAGLTPAVHPPVPQNVPIVAGQLTAGSQVPGPGPATAAAPTHPSRRGRTTLAQPIGPLWRDAHSGAIQEDTARLDLKAQQLAMEERGPTTCDTLSLRLPPLAALAATLSPKSLQSEQPATLSAGGGNCHPV
ncbi:hypothetical protein B0H11DRAFT_1899440 [Mycena galericulata]|nr:hypothetical protein B0H11DRAFT_1899440 [Mycena galericulata]